MEIENASKLDRFDELNRRIAKTSKCRFIAARRLGQHHKFSQWTISLISVLLIVIPLLQAIGVTTRYSPQFLSVIQVSLAVLILVFSLLIGMDNYAVRAERMHNCGLELRNLAWGLEAFKGKGGSDEEYRIYCERYFTILKSYENHATVDYLQSKLKERKWYYPTRISFALAVVKTGLVYAMGFTPYIFLFIVMLVIMWLMVR